MTSPKIKIETRTCLDCGQEYEAQVAKVLMRPFIMGGGLCSACADRKYQKELKQEQAKRAIFIQATKERWLKQCGIPLRFMKKGFETFDKKRQPIPYKFSLDYANNYPFDIQGLHNYSSLILFSEHSWGVGKTHLAVAVVKRVIQRWNGEGINWEYDGRREVTCPILFVSELDLYTRLQASYGFSTEVKKESEADIIKRLVGVDLLILDDVGKRKVTDSKFVNRIMFSIIQGRYNAELPLVMTANLDSGDLAVYLSDGQGDEASMDRLVEMCGGKFYRVEGESYRRFKLGAGGD